MYVASLRGGSPGGVGKPSVNSAFIPREIEGIKFYTSDPKPGELALGRVNLREIEGEARTG